MKSYREWVGRLPASAQFVVLALIIAVVWFVFSAARGRPSLGAPIVIGVLFSALITPVAITRRRITGALRTMVIVSAAIRTGALPAGEGPLDRVGGIRWIPELDRRRRIGLQLAGLSAVLILAGVAFAVVSIVRPDVFEQQLSHILSAVLFGGLGVYLASSAVLLLARIRRLRGVLGGAGRAGVVAPN